MASRAPSSMHGNPPRPRPRGQSLSPSVASSVLDQGAVSRYFACLSRDDSATLLLQDPPTPGLALDAQGNGVASKPVGMPPQMPPAVSRAAGEGSAPAPRSLPSQRARAAIPPHRSPASHGQAGAERAGPRTWQKLTPLPPQVQQKTPAEDGASKARPVQAAELQQQEGRRTEQYDEQTHVARSRLHSRGGGSTGASEAAPRPGVPLTREEQELEVRRVGRSRMKVPHEYLRSLSLHWLTLTH